MKVLKKAAIACLMLHNISANADIVRKDFCLIPVASNGTGYVDFFHLATYMNEDGTFPNETVGQLNTHKGFLFRHTLVEIDEVPAAKINIRISKGAILRFYSLDELENLLGELQIPLNDLAKGAIGNKLYTIQNAGCYFNENAN